jgi:hypothetical protein
METVADYFGSWSLDKKTMCTFLPKGACQGVKNWAFSKGAGKPNKSTKMSKSKYFLTSQNPKIKI